MSDKTINTRIKNKYDTELNWSTQNPVLLAGEVVYSVGSDGKVKTKVGNGTSHYNDLAFISGGSEITFRVWENS